MEMAIPILVVSIVAFIVFFFAISASRSRHLWPVDVPADRAQAQPRKNEVPPHLRPGFQRVLTLLLLATSVGIIVINSVMNRLMPIPGPTLPAMLLAFVIGAGLGMTTLRLRIKLV